MKEELSAEAVAAGLGTEIIGRRVLYYPSLASTMLAAKAAAARGIEEGAVIIAGEQTAGRGRRGRTWLTPAGGVALSVVLRPALEWLPSLIMVASLGVTNSIETVTGLKPAIKWPNDVLIGDKKVCGILIENELRGESVNWSVIGIGINVNVRLADYPDVRDIATSLSDELRYSVSRLEVIRRLLIELDNLYLSLKAGGPVYEAWRTRLATLGRQVRLVSGQSALEGTAEDVERDGSLLLRLPDGTLYRAVAGEVSLRY